MDNSTSNISSNMCIGDQHVFVWSGGYTGAIPDGTPCSCGAVVAKWETCPTCKHPHVNHVPVGEVNTQKPSDKTICPHWSRMTDGVHHVVIDRCFNPDCDKWCSESTKAPVAASFEKYHNTDPQCTYPFTNGPAGYCWTYAHCIDNNIPITNKTCENCDMWKPMQVYNANNV